jgi:hypothetical protein
MKFQRERGALQVRRHTLRAIKAASYDAESPAPFLLEESPFVSCVHLFGVALESLSHPATASVRPDPYEIGSK